uniref:Uncharacterized protein n=1 Tax=Megaselia scalaris TaxID=36166 RepID=T1GH51_MEGSC
MEKRRAKSFDRNKLKGKDKARNVESLETKTALKDIKKLPITSGDIGIYSFPFHPFHDHCSPFRYLSERNDDQSLAL